MADRAFERTYRDVPDELVESLKAFREAHPPQTITVEAERVEQVTWTYVTGGEGEATILFLHSVPTTWDTYFLQIAALEADYRVVVPAIPAVPTMKEISDGLAAILDEVGVEQVHVYGVAFGGEIAQAFVRHYPERVASLILSHTLPPGKRGAEDATEQRHAIRSRPEFLFETMSVRARMTELSNDIPAFRPDEQAFWEAYFTELYPARVDKETIMGRYEAAINYHTAYEFEKDGPEGWDGRVLIVESARDDTMRETDKAALRALYPGAAVHTVAEYGHTGMIARVDEYVGPVRDFLAGG
jgi:pimeloyl-ACP methyl ester carboxylesterase